MSNSLGRVLVVDDEPQVAAMLKEMVSYLGYSVELTPTGEDGLRAVAALQPDVVLLDISLPGMSGETVLERLRVTHPHVPVIMVTGNADLEVAQRTLDQGAFDYIAKPFDLVRLRQVLDAARRPEDEQQQ
jgi:DNA-binding response OmpR family regulator